MVLRVEQGLNDKSNVREALSLLYFVWSHRLRIPDVSFKK